MLVAKNGEGALTIANKAKPSLIMTVMFADVRGWTTLSENMTPQENFQFNQVLQENPGDKAARIYLERSAHYMVKGVPEDWTGVEGLTRK